MTSSMFQIIPGNRRMPSMMPPLKMGRKHVREQDDTWKILCLQVPFEDEAGSMSSNPDLCLQT